MKFKRVFIVLLLAIISFSGFLFGCGDKYSNLNVKSDKDETGLQLYLGEDDAMEGGATPSIGSITFTVNGAGSEVSSNLKFNYDQKYIKILDLKKVENKTTVTLQAIDGGTSNFIAITEEGEKQDIVKVDCIRRITDLKFNPEYNPAIFNEQGSSITINSKQIIFNNGDPNGTTQTEVEYSALYNISGINVSSDGVVTIEEKLAFTNQPITIVATSVADPSLSDQIDVHIIDVIDNDDISLITQSSTYSQLDEKITLTTDGEESYITFDIDVNVTENVAINYILVEEDGITSLTSNIVALEYATNGIHIYANSIGKCKLVIEVSLIDYDEAQIVKKYVDIEVIQLPKNIYVNGIATDFNDDIYTYYKNGLGKKYSITIGENLAYDKKFAIASDNTSNFIVRRVDGSVIDLAELQYNSYDDEYILFDGYSVLNSGTDIYVLGNQPNQTLNLYIYPLGIKDHKSNLVRKISISTLLGSNHVDPIYKSLSGQTTNSFFVEVGKEIEIGYEIDNNSSAKNLRLLNADGTNINGVVSVDIGDGIKPVVKIKGLSSGELNCKLVLDNLVESEVFKIVSFVSLKYDDAPDNTLGGFYVSADNASVNRNIAYTHYSNGSLDEIVIARNSTAQLYLSTNPNNGTIFDSNFEVFIENGGDLDVKNYISINKFGYVVTRQGLPNKVVVDGEEVIPQLKIRVLVYSLVTDNAGNTELLLGSKTINVTIYVPISNVELSKTSSTIYWFENLNVIQKEQGAYKDDIALTFYPNSVDLSKVNVIWDIDLQRNENRENKSATIYAYNMPQNVANVTLHTLTITINYYSTTIVRRVVFTVINPIIAKNISAYVDDVDNTVAYFDISNGANVQPIQVHSKVLSNNGSQNVTFSKVYYRIEDNDQYIATVSEDGKITAHEAGICELKVYSEDMISAQEDKAPFQYKVITIVVADGQSNRTALRLRTADDFKNIKSDLYYYFNNNIRLTDDYYLSQFNGSIDGRGYYLQNVNLSNYGSLFGELSNNAVIYNLNISALYNIVINEGNYEDYTTRITQNEELIEPKTISGLSKVNNGIIQNVNIEYVSASVNFADDIQNADDINLQIAGLTNTNNGSIDNCSVSMNGEISSNKVYYISQLYFGGFAVINNGYLLGKNDNYQYFTNNFVQDYEFMGSLYVSDNLFAFESAIGGLVAINNYDAENQKDSIIGAYDNGLAADIVIYAKNLDNVGGVAGVNYSIVKNALVKADITANNNVGGIAGMMAVGFENLNTADISLQNSPAQKYYTDVLNNYIYLATIQSSVVELYQDVNNRDNYGKIAGNNNIGGLVGFIEGKYHLLYNDNNTTEDILTEEEIVAMGGDVTIDDFNDLTIYLSGVTNSYVKSYTQGAYISGLTNIGGLAGNAKLTNFVSCFADVNINAIVNDAVIGGIVGTAEAVEIDKAYYIGELKNSDNLNAALAIGKVEPLTFGDNLSTEYNIQICLKTLINEFYSPSLISESFVCSGDSINYNIQNSYCIVTDIENQENNVTQDDLKQISTFESWAITNENLYQDYNWYISPSVNSGYPVLIFGKNIMQKAIATQLYVFVNDEIKNADEDLEKIEIINEENDEYIVILQTKKNYLLSDILSIQTNVNSKTNIYAYCDVDDILFTKNTNNRLTNLATLYSYEPIVITLTFVLGNNPNIMQSVQIAFVNCVESYKIDEMHIKKGESINVLAQVAYELSIKDEPIYEILSRDNYKIGLNVDSISDKFEITNQTQQNIDGVEKILFENNSILKGEAYLPNTNFVSELYYQLNYNNLSENQRIIYVKVAECEFDLSIYSGASQIQITTTNIDMTLIDNITFTVTVDTDKENDILLIDLDSHEIGFDGFELETNEQDEPLQYKILVSKNSTYSDLENSKLILKLIASDYKDNQLVTTFELCFADRFLDANDKFAVFNKIFNSNIKFYADSDKSISTNLNISAIPQKLYKIDVINYSAGETDGNIYSPKETSFGNTLTPGQVGMMVIDLYPEFAYFDNLEIISGVDNKGNRISFIQAAKDVNSDNYYLEVKPSSVLTEEGIILQKISNIDLSSNQTSFNGRIYVKTLMGTNVDFDQKIIVTIKATTNIYDTNNQIIEVHSLTKSIEIIVNQAPSLKLEYNGTYNQGFVNYYESYKLNNEILFRPSVKLLNLAGVGQKLNFSLSYDKLNLERISSEVNGECIKDANGNDIYANQWIEISDINNNAFEITITKDCKPGTLITICVYGNQIINNFNETYESNKIQFMVVDFVMRNTASVNNDDNNYFIEQYNEVTAEISVYRFDEIDRNSFDYDENVSNRINQGINNIENILNTNPNYWYGILDYQWISWNFENNNMDLRFDAYYGYKLPDTQTNKFGIVAVKQNSKENRFKLQFPYYYDFIDGSYELGYIQINDNNDFAYNTVEHIVEMNIKVLTNIDEPIPVYTIEQFYEMQTKTDVDYILMNDLYFGLTDEEYINLKNKEIEDDTYTKDTYKPFDLVVNSFDGNTYSIYIYGNVDITSDNSLGLFNRIDASTILQNLEVKYLPKTNNDTYAINYSNNDGNSNLDRDILYFGGLTAYNYGVVSNCHVHYLGDVNISLKKSDGSVNIAGFVSQNNGKITYSSVFGTDFNEFLENKKLDKVICNTKLETKNSGSMATFVNSNSNLISNCQAEFLGLKNTAPANANAKVAGFVTNNTSSAKIINSSIAGQRINHIYQNKFGDSEEYNDLTSPLPLSINDVRVLSIFKYLMIEDYKKNKPNTEITDAIISNIEEQAINKIKDIYFARIDSQATVAGFVYTNSGSITNAYSSIPMDTQSRSAGFVYDNSNSGIVSTSYTASIYDGNSQSNTAHAPFVGTDELSKILNDTEKCIIEYCYYISEISTVYEEDVLFKEPATRLSLEINENGSANYILDESFDGFDFGNDSSYVWSKDRKYQLPDLNACVNNYNNRKVFHRSEHPIIDKDGKTKIIFIRDSDGNSSDIPLTIANGLQFINVFTNNRTNENAFVKNVRLINDIDLTDYAGTEEFNNIKKVIFVKGDFDGNGMTIKGIKISGTSGNSTSIYSNVSDAFGLFNQIGTATKQNEENNELNINFNGDNGKTYIRNLTLEVKEISSSTSAFTGILAGVIINTDIKNLTINAEGVTVLGKNAVGGVAGAILGNSSLYNVSVNASVTSSAGSPSLSTQNKKISDIDKYQSFNYFIEENKTSNKYKDYIIGDNENKRFDILQYYVKNNIPVDFSYAGGIAGIIDLYDSNSYTELKEDVSYLATEQTVMSNFRKRISNLNLVKVNGNVKIAGEVVGGLFGVVNDNSLIINSKFVVSEGQQLNGYYTSGGLVGINNGGAIYLSTVELNIGSAKSNDEQLTNKTGNNLFNSDNRIYPMAIGGMVGIQKGGYIVSSYTKTNVINNKALYAGGVVGYVIENDKIINNNIDGKYKQDGKTYIKYGAYIYMEEVYTTGNVTACDGYKISGNLDSIIINPNYNLNISTDNSTIARSTGNGVSINSIKYAVPKGYAGGIIGYYKANSIDCFAGVLGINAFHKPNGYSIVNGEYLPIKVNADGELVYNVNKDEYTTLNLTYSNLVAGYYGVKQLSTGDNEIIYFGAKSGSIFGKVDASECNELVNTQKQVNFFTNFVYNGENITNVDCRNSNGNVLTYLANTVNGSYTINTDKGFDSYLINLSGGTNTILLNSLGLSDSENIHFTPSNSYLVYRGIDANAVNYSQYKQDNSGLYKDWSDNWIYKSPIYPKIKPNDKSAYEEIFDEDGLKSIRSGIKYKIMNDIYLTSPWTPLNSLTNISLESVVRTDGEGIKFDNEAKSIYYSIYNINISDNANVEYSGFFRAIGNSSIIKNINFVFGTELESYSGSKGISFSSNSKTQSIGLIVGNLANQTSISGCNVYINKEVANINVNTPQDLDKINVGGFVGKSVKSVVTNCSLNAVEVNDEFNLTSSSVNLNVNINSNATEVNAGGFVGKVELTELAFNDNILNGVNLVVDGKSKVISDANIGGFAGIVSNRNIGNLDIKNDVTVNNFAKNTTNNFKCGGAFGEVSQMNIDNIHHTGNISINNTSADVAYIGGLVASLNNSSISNSIAHSTLFNIGTSNYNYLYIGGFVGQVISVGSVEINKNKTNFDQLMVSVIATNSYIGGFVASQSVTNDINKPITYNNCLSMGEMILEKGYINVAGFIASGEDGKSNKIYYGKINNSVSAVNITLKEINSTFNASAFAGDYVSSATGCIALGNIVYDSNKPIHSDAKISGFNNSKSKTNTSFKNNWANNYTLSTIKAISSINNIRATYFYDVDGLKNNEKVNSNNISIYYNYNLSGVFQDINIGSECTYQELLNDFGEGDNKVSGAKAQLKINLLRQQDSDDFFENDYTELTKLGKKINPYTSIGTAFYIDYQDSVFQPGVKNRDYVLINEKRSLECNENYIDCQVIANDSKNAISVYLSNNNKHFKVYENAMLSGFELFVSDNIENSLIISENYGYIFNCLTTGRVVTPSNSNDGDVLSGFVDNNLGLINGSLSMAYLEAKDIVNTTGFVNTNSGVIANSAATNVFLNTAGNKTNVGFVYSNSGKIINCFASPSMYNMDSSGNNTMKNSYGFAKSSSGLTSCYYEKIKSSGNGGTNLTILNNYEVACNKTTEMFLKTNGTVNYTTSKDNVLSANTRNYGYATPTTFITVYGNSKYATYNTGTNESGNPYKVNNVGRFTYLTQTAQDYVTDKGVKQNIYLKLVNNIDAALTGNIDSTNYTNTDSIISIVNDNQYSIINLKLSVDTSKSDCIGLISANKIVIKNFGVIGKFSNNSIKIEDKNYNGWCGLLIGFVNNLTANNCFAICTQSVDISVRHFGFFAGEIANGIGNNVLGDNTIKNCFASGDYTSNLGAFHGTFIGCTSNIKSYSNCFGTGTTTISDDKAEEKYVGLIGCNWIGDGIITMCYSNVTFRNEATSNYQLINVDPIINDSKNINTANSDYSSCKYNEYITLCSGNGEHSINMTLNLDPHGVFWTTENEKHYPIQKEFVGNNFVYKYLDISSSSETGSKMSPIFIDNLLNANDKNKYYVISADINNYESKSLLAKMIIGNEHTITSTDENPIINSISNNVIVSALTIQNAPFADNFSGYAYKINVSGSFTNNEGYAFVGKTNNLTVFDYCQINNLDFYSSNSEIKTFIYEIDHSTTILRNISINETINSSANQVDKLTITGIGDFGKNTYYSAWKTYYIGNIELDITTTAINQPNNYYFGGCYNTQYSNTMARTPYFYGTISQLNISNSIYGKTNSYIGGISAEEYNNNDNSNDTYANISANANLVLSGTYTKTGNIYLGVAYGKDSIRKTVISGNNNINIGSDVEGTSSEQSLKNIYIGSLSGAQISRNASNSTISGKLTVNIVKRNDSSTINAMIDKYIGGLTGYFGGTSKSSNCLVSADVNVTDNNNQIASTCYVGGIAGKCDSSGRFTNVESSGLVVGLSYSANTAITTKIYDARTYGNDGNGNYKTKSTTIPLVVGGIFGYYGYNSNNFNNTNSLIKNTGDVRGLLAADSKDRFDSIYNNGSDWNSLFASIDNYETQYVNSEKLRASVGGFAGLISSYTKQYSYNKEKLNIRPSATYYNYPSGHGTFGETVGVSGVVREIADSYDSIGTAISYFSKTSNSMALSYKLDKFTSNYGLYKETYEGNNFVRNKLIGTLFGFQLYKSQYLFNYSGWSKSTEAITDTASITPDNIFGISNSNSLKFNGEKLFTITGFWQYRRKAGLTGDGGYWGYPGESTYYRLIVTNGKDADGNDEQAIKINADAYKIYQSPSVFSGFTYKNSSGNYVTENRSYWLVGDSDVGGGYDAWNSTRYVRINEYFYPTQHWAGTTIGAVIAA